MVVSFRKATGFLVRSFFILLVIPASGQDKKDYTLADFVDSARRHLPILLQKMALVNSARAGITDARHTYLPTAILGDQLSLGTDNSIPGSYLSFGLIPSSSAGVRSTN